MSNLVAKVTEVIKTYSALLNQTLFQIDDEDADLSRGGDRKPTDTPKGRRRVSSRALAQRLSITFDCKTDIDQIKAMTPEIITDRRKSLLIAVERKRSIVSQDGDNRKLSSPQQFGRKLSCEAYSPHFSPLPLGTSPTTADEHNKLNKMMSMPTHLKDETD